MCMSPVLYIWVPYYCECGMSHVWMSHIRIYMCHINASRIHELYTHVHVMYLNAHTQARARTNVHTWNTLPHTHTSKQRGTCAPNTDMGFICLSTKNKQILVPTMPCYVHSHKSDAHTYASAHRHTHTHTRARVRTHTHRQTQTQTHRCSHSTNKTSLQDIWVLPILLYVTLLYFTTLYWTVWLEFEFHWLYFSLLDFTSFILHYLNLLILLYFTWLYLFYFTWLYFYITFTLHILYLPL